jgi:protein-S-isoprenylcysteine O-methyltransferase Ste14
MPFKNKVEKLISPLFMWLIVLSGIFLAINQIPAIMIFKRNVFTSLIIVLAALYWFYFFVMAIVAHRHAASSVAGIHHIVDKGVYGLVRHPIYAADIVLAWGIFFYYANLAVLLSVIWLTLVLFVWIKLEEKFLIKKFGADYLAYQKKVPMVIPRKFKLN